MIQNVKIEGSNEHSYLIAFRIYEYDEIFPFYNLHWAIVNKNTGNVIDVDDSFLEGYGLNAIRYIEDYVRQNKVRLLLKGL